MDRKPLPKWLDNLNVSRAIATHVLGSNHTHAHRIAIGTGVAFTGVVIAHSAAELIWIISIPLDFLGYALHGIGLIPFIDHISSDEKIDDKCSR